MHLMPTGYFLSRLAAVGALLLLPLLALHAYTLQREYVGARETTIRTVQGSAADTRRELNATLLRAENLLRFLASRDELRSADAAACSRLLKNLTSVDPTYLNVGAVALDGRRLCLAAEGSGVPPPASFVNTEWFSQLGDVQGPTLLGPFPGRVAAVPVAILAQPVRDRNGERIAFVGVTLNLAAIAESLQTPGLPEGSSVTLMSAGNRVLARAPDFAQWVGKSAQVDPAYRQRLLASGFATAVGIDGVERLFAVGEIPRYGLRISAGVPMQAILTPIVDQAIRSALLAGVVLLLGAAVAMQWARGLTRPFLLLRQATRAVASNPLGVRVPDDLPGEFHELAIDFNRMAASLERTMSDLNQATHRSMKLTRLYQALSGTNQAITRPGERDALLQEICDLLVDTGHATMVWIGLHEGIPGTVVAAAGRAREYLALAAQTFSIDDHSAVGPAAEAGRTGDPYIANDFANDPLTGMWKQLAPVFGIQACASFPFRQGSQIAGVLNLFVDEAGFFDEQVVQLLKEIASDVSYALDTAQSEKVRTAVQRALERREFELTGFVESARDAIVTTDNARRILGFNRAASMLFGVTEAAALGQPVEHFIPQAAQPGQEQYAAYLLGKDAAAHTGPIALTGVKADGARVPLEVSFSPFGSKDEGMRTLVIRDATLLREAELALVLRAEAVAANWAKTNFLSKMSHELRTPLNAVLGFSELLIATAQLRLTPQESQQVELIHMAGVQLLALVDDVLDVSSIEAGHVLVSMRDVELVEQLDGAMVLSATVAQAADVQLIAGYRRVGSMPLRSDPVRLRQVMLNLLSNGIKYNRRGGSVTVDVDLGAGATDLRIRVADTGLGMTAEQLQSLFQPFNRLGRESSAIVGTGLGMALTRQLVELMGGGIAVQSEPGVGTLFTVTLPFLPAETENGLIAGTVPVRSPTVADPSMTAAAEPQGVVVYVEDNLVNVLLVQQMLVLWPKVRVLVAEDGASGLRLIASALPDVLLLDMHLPDMSGLDVLQVLRRLPHGASLPIIALSASAMAEDVAEALAAGATDYWTKPLDVQQFRHRIAILLSAVPSHALGSSPASMSSTDG